LSWWLIVGTLESWKIALKDRGVWRLKDTPRHRAMWRRIDPGDGLLFYATVPVGGVVGFGSVTSKFREVKAMWPNRFRFKVRHLIPEKEWREKRISTYRIASMVRGGFQEIGSSVAEEAIKLMAPKGEASDLSTVRARPWYSESKAGKPMGA
jgi:EVE domain